MRHALVCTLMDVLTTAQKAKFLVWMAGKRKKNAQKMAAFITSQYARNETSGEMSTDSKRHEAANLYILNHKLSSAARSQSSLFHSTEGFAEKCSGEICASACIRIAGDRRWCEGPTSEKYKWWKSEKMFFWNELRKFGWWQRFYEEISFWYFDQWYFLAYTWSCPNSLFYACLSGIRKRY